MTRHKWADQIHAWAEGAEIEYRIVPVNPSTDDEDAPKPSAWMVQKHPQWYVSDGSNSSWVGEYRVKPGDMVGERMKSSVVTSTKEHA